MSERYIRVLDTPDTSLKLCTIDGVANAIDNSEITTTNAIVGNKVVLDDGSMTWDEVTAESFTYVWEDSDGTIKHYGYDGTFAYVNGVGSEFNTDELPIVVGKELVPFPDFSNGGADWTTWGGTSADGSGLHVSKGAGFSGGFTSNITTIGKLYQAKINVVSITSGSASLAIGNGTSTHTLAVGMNIIIDTNTGINGSIIIQGADNPTEVLIDYVSVRPINGASDGISDLTGTLHSIKIYNDVKSEAFIKMDYEKEIRYW